MKQKRSLETRNNLLQAASELMAEKNFEDIAVIDVVERAGVSVGAFYGRFENKKALFDSLIDQFWEAQTRLAEKLAETPALELDWRINRLIHIIDQEIKGWRPFMRELLIKQLQEGNKALGAPPKNTAVAEAVQNYILQDEKEINHRDPKTAARVVHFLITWLMLSNEFFPESTQGISQTRFKGELKAMILGYL